MQKNPHEPNGVSSLFPFPEGWYFVASRRTIEKKKLLRRTWLGEQVVIWCNESGDVCVAEAVCPHLGADLSPEAGGRVRNGCLVCPFHGFEYDVTGRCVATPYAPAPKSARLRVFETRDILGLVFAWRGNGGRPPQWDLSAPPADGSDWSEMEFWNVRFPGHPQETTENSVDLGHLRYVHGYDSVKGVGPVSVDGAYLRSCFDFKRTQTVAGIRAFSYDVSAVTHVHGFGYSFVEVREHAIGMDTRLWVLATPIDGEIVEMTLVSQVRKLLRPKRPIVGMRFLPPRLRTRVMNKIIIAAQKRDVSAGRRYLGPETLSAQTRGSAARTARSACTGVIANSSTRTDGPATRTRRNGLRSAPGVSVRRRWGVNFGNELIGIPADSFPCRT